MFYIAVFYPSCQINKVTLNHVLPISGKPYSSTPPFIYYKMALIKTINVKKKNSRGSTYLLESKEEETFNQFTLIDDLMVDGWLQVKSPGYSDLWTGNDTVSLCYILISNCGILG